MMLLWGTRDGALSKEMAPLCAEHASDFRLEYIDGASHWVQQDEPQKVNILIQDFLNQKWTIDRVACEACDVSADRH